MENVVKASVIAAGVLVFLYDHHHALAASGGKMSGQESSSSCEVYHTQTSSPAASSYPDRTRNPPNSSSNKCPQASGWPVGYVYIAAKGFAAASTSKGLSYALQEATLALLRHPDYCISGYSSADVKRSVFECEKLFIRFSIEERSKFDVVNANDIRKKSATSQSSNNEYIVVTIIVVVDGVAKLPSIRSSAELKNALQMLASIPSSDIKKVKMFWNPQEENNFLTAQELLEDYALLNPI